MLSQKFYEKRFSFSLVIAIIITNTGMMSGY